MDPTRNPFAPGAGSPPPDLIGRENLREDVRIALTRIRNGLAAKSVLLVGLRGVGKTVLLDAFREDALALGLETLRLEAPEGRSLPALLVPALRVALLRLSRNDKAKDLAQRALRGLAGFVGALKAKYGDLEVSLDLDPEPGLADNGDLEFDLQALFEVVGEAARHAESALVLFVDELQYVPEKQLAALIVSLHRTAQRRLPVVLVGAGLPQLRAQMGNAKSYAERLFDFPPIGPLNPDDARRAIEKPIRDTGESITQRALDQIAEQTQGYPYFLQEWGKHVWDAAEASPIEPEDVDAAGVTALASLDRSFFLVRFDRLTPKEKTYLRAMAHLGPGPHRTGDISAVLDKKASALGTVRANLITKGMVYSPSHGDTAFTVPLFDAFMQRIMPGDDWRA